MLLQTRIHTVLVLVGPTECGKSTFAREVLVPQLRVEEADKHFHMNVQVLSSDDIRRELLGFDYDKHDRMMLEASAQAFDLLEKRLEVATRFPVNAEFVIVDTKGLSEEFRKRVCDIAKESQYHVEAIVFDYRDTKDFYVEGTNSHTLIAADVRRMRAEVVASLRKSGFDRIHRVKARDFLDDQGKGSAEYRVEIENREAYLATILPVDREYFVIGDVHEELDALKKLLQQKGFSVDGDTVTPTEQSVHVVPIFVGDLIDKGGRTAETIHFFAKNRALFKLVRGNHENFVEKYLLGEIHEDSVPEGLIANQFTSIAVLEQDDELRELFFELVAEMLPFCRYIGVTQPSFYVTHAPCLNKYLGKLDRVSLRKQRGFVLNRDEDVEPQLAFLQEEAVGNHPYHVFGHIASQNEIHIKNKIGIDTGAVYGNRLLSMAMRSGKLFFRSVAVSKEEKGPLPRLFERQKQTVSLDNLSEYDNRRLHYILRNRIHYLSGTISPADKNKDTGELESLEMGLQYFRSKGIARVCMQPKYMGSRCTVYLGKTIDECYAVSRNGYKIRNVDLSEVYERLLARHLPDMKRLQMRMIILDGELMPWMALGRGLIEGQFKVIDTALAQEIAFLKAQGFEDHLARLQTDYTESDFSRAQPRMSKKELLECYGDAVYGKFKHVREAVRNLAPLGEHEEAHRQYHEQIALFGADAEMDYKPFDLLKVIFEDGAEQVPADTTSVIFGMVSDDECVVIDFSDPDYMASASAFYETLTTERKMEGVVMKPEVHKSGVAPALKVRNPAYLRIIYGYDYTFTHKYTKLFNQKSIGAKLSTAIKEYQLGKQMLAFPMDAITLENEEYKQVVANMLFETSKEATIDPRL